MLTCTPQPVACCTKRRQVLRRQQFINNLVQRTRIVNMKLFTVQILFFVFIFRITAQFKLCSPVNLRNPETHNLVAHSSIFAGCKYQPGIRHCQPQYGHQPGEFLIRNTVFAIKIHGRCFLYTREGYGMRANIIAGFEMIGVPYQS